LPFRLALPRIYDEEQRIAFSIVVMRILYVRLATQ
jgi:hypothetical protein